MWMQRKAATKRAASRIDKYCAASTGVCERGDAPQATGTASIAGRQGGGA